MNSLRELTGLGLVFGVFSVAYAQTEAHQHEELEELIVISTPLGDTTAEIAQPVSVLSGDELKDKRSITIGETLANELGVSASDFGQAVSRPIIRGLVGPRVRILESGIGSMDLSSLSADHVVSIEPFHAEQIEVLRGPATLLYGNGAIGGVINIINRRIPGGSPRSKPSGAEFLVQGDTGSDEQAVMFAIDGDAGRFAWHLDGVDRKTGDYEIPGFADLEHASNSGDEHWGIVENSDLDMSDVAAGFSYSGNSVFWGLSVSHMENNYGLPGETHDHDAGGGSSAEQEGPRLDMEQTRVDVKAQIEAPFKGYQRVIFRAGANDYQHAELEGQDDVGTLFENDEAEARLELVHEVRNNWEGALGIQYNRRQFSALGEEAYIPPVDSESLGLFIVEHKHLEKWNIELGARFEDHQYDASGGLIERSYSVSSYSAGMVRSLGEDHSVGLSFSQSARAPSSEELFSYGPHLVTRSFERGNTLLKKETSGNIDLSLRGQHEALSWQVNFFLNEVDNYIFLQSQDTDNDGIADRVDEEGLPVMDEDELLLVDYVQQDARLSGVEAEAVFDLLHTAISKLDLRVFADSVKGELKDSERLPRMTPKRVGAGLNYEHYAWRFGVDVVRVADQDKIAVLETATKGYMLVNAAVTYTLPWAASEMDVYIKGKNLTDEEARRHTSFLKNQAPLPGRTFVAGIRVAF